MFSRFKKSISNVYSYPVVDVVNDMALTPSKMKQYSDAGIPISSSIDSSTFDDGDETNIIRCDYFRQRGIDLVDVWNFQQDSRKKVTNNLIVKNG